MNFNAAKARIICFINKEMSYRYVTSKQTVLELISANDFENAAAKVGVMFNYPGTFDSDAEFIDAIKLLAKVMNFLGRKELAEVAMAAVEKTNRINMLYQLGYQLGEANLHSMEDTVLSYAISNFEQHEQYPRLITELVYCLETMGEFEQACKILKEQPRLLETNFMCQYLLAINSIMCGDINTAKKMRHQFLANDNIEIKMAERIRRMIERFDAIENYESIDTNDLQFWHYIITGGILMHVSPYGYENAMYGRYGVLQEGYKNCLMGIQYLKNNLEKAGISPTCIYSLGDRSSDILAHAAAEYFQLPLKPWVDEELNETSLIIAYDVTSSFDTLYLEKLKQRHPRQILWSHVTIWDKDQPIAADITTLLAQVAIPPWGKQSHPRLLDNGEPILHTQPSDQREVTEIANDILMATEGNGTVMWHYAEDDVPLLNEEIEKYDNLDKVLLLTSLSFIDKVAQGAGREPMWAASPVKSNGLKL